MKGDETHLTQISATQPASLAVNSTLLSCRVFGRKAKHQQVKIP